MSSEVEFKGTTVGKAVAKACQQLDIKEEYLNFTVVTEGSTGIFGLVGVKKALIRVISKEKQADRDETQPDDKFNSKDEEAIAVEPGNLTAAARAGRNAIEKIVNSITAGASIAIMEEGKRVSYDITGGKAGILIGKRGQTLEAVQYLVEKVVNRNSKERVRVSIDVGGYLAKKRQNLESLAERTAQKAKKNGTPVTLGQLNAHDRRIIHLALKENEDVITKSMGTGFLRKLVVLPKNRRSHPKRRP
jgi:spoIIIJ-associated protein